MVSNCNFLLQCLFYLFLIYFTVIQANSSNQIVYLNEKEIYKTSFEIDVLYYIKLANLK